MKWLSAPGAAFQRWRAVGQLRSIEKREAADHHWDFDGMIDEAADMLERGQPSRAADLWRQANARFPDLAMQSRSLVNILLRLRLFDEAEDLLNRSMRRYPRSAHPLENLARVAYTRGDREEAVRRCEALRKKYPKSLDGYWSAAASLSELGRSQEAEDILGRGLKVIPDDVRLRAEHAKLAERRSDWEEGLRRWTIVLEIFNDVSGAVGIANALVQLGRHDEAEQQLSNILHQWGAYISVWIGLAQIAEHKEDWEEAARRWGVVRHKFPMEMIGYRRGAAATLKTAQPESADEVLREGMERTPDRPELWIDYALLAHRRHEWPEAIRRWAEVRERFPMRSEGYTLGSNALAAVGNKEEAAKLKAMAT